MRRRSDAARPESSGVVRSARPLSAVWCGEHRDNVVGHSACGDACCGGPGTGDHSPADADAGRHDERADGEDHLSGIGCDLLHHDAHAFERRGVNDLQGKALMVAESANLLMMPAHMRDEDRWLADAKLMRDAGMAAFKAAKAKDVQALEDLNDAMYQSCVTVTSTIAPITGDGHERRRRSTPREEALIKESAAAGPCAVSPRVCTIIARTLLPGE